MFKTLIFKAKKGREILNRSFSILHLNIHSIRLHIEDLRILTSLLNFNFDIIAIFESKIQCGILPAVDISIEGYKTPLSTETDAFKGGVHMYIAKHINVKPRNDLTIYKSKKLESLFIEVNNPNKANDIIGVIYRHPSMDRNDFNDNFLKPLLDKLSMEKNKNMYITGDFNFDLLKTSSHDDTSDFFNLMTSNYLLPLITLPTRINHINNTLIDNIFSNQFNPDFITGNLTTGLSDHLPSFIIVPKSNQIHLPKKHNIYKRDTKNFDQASFLLEIKSIDWKILQIEKSDVDQSFNTFIEVVNKKIDKYMPYKKVTRKQFKRKYKPWITE